VPRDDLPGAWQGLQDWAGHASGRLVQERDRAVAAAHAALAGVDAQIATIEAYFTVAGAVVPPRSLDPASYREAAALAAQSRDDALRHVLARREQAARLVEQAAAQEHEALVAKSLALHLRADRFERWVLAEALDTLVRAASAILRQLSSGQYDLASDKGEFFVVDHAEAGLRRAVRTLSGGETFQASLALALALAEQLAGLSNSASLESVLLDEGFGTLDASTLDTVAATLENLAALGERMVGVVTHVPELAERIPHRFEVTKDARGVARIARTR
jgi:exonuclease SbcC